MRATARPLALLRIAKPVAALRSAKAPAALALRASLAALLLPAAVGLAHHSQQPFFKMDQNLVIEGIVSKFEFQNPHPIIYLDVADETGAKVEWQIEGPTAIYLSRNGWTAKSVVPGEHISVRGAPPKKAGAHAMAGREVVKDDGTRLTMYAEDARRVLELEQ